MTTARSNQSHTITLHTYTPNQCPYQVSTTYKLWFLRYILDEILKVKVTAARAKVKSRSHQNVALLLSPSHVQQVSTSYTFRFLRCSPDKILKVKVTSARLKVKSRSHHDVDLFPLTNIPTKYQHLTPHGFQDTAQT